MASGREKVGNEVRAVEIGCKGPPKLVSAGNVDPDAVVQNEKAP